MNPDGRKELLGRSNKKEKPFISNRAVKVILSILACFFLAGGGVTFWEKSRGQGLILAHLASLAENPEDHGFVDMDSLPMVENREFTSDELKDLIINYTPEEVYLMVLNGQLPLKTMRVLLATEVVVTDEEGKIRVSDVISSTVEMTRTASALHMEVHRPDGSPIGVYHSHFTDFRGDLPPVVLRYVQLSEGMPEDNMEWSPFILGKIGRSILQGNPSGRSTVFAQIVDMMAGLDTAPINPDLQGSLDISNYELDLLIEAFNDGGYPVPEGVSSLVGDDNLDSYNAKQKFLSFILARLLLARHGEHSGTLEYANLVDMGNLWGSRIIGFPAFSRLFFGKDINELNRAEILIMMAVIPNAQRTVTTMTSDDDSVRFEYQSGLIDIALAKANNMNSNGNMSDQEYQEVLVQLEQIRSQIPRQIVPLPEFRNDFMGNEDIPFAERNAISVLANMPLEELAKLDFVEFSTEGIRINLPQSFVDQFDPRKAPEREIYPNDKRLEQMLVRSREGGGYSLNTLTYFAREIGIISPGEVLQVPVSHDSFRYGEEVPGVGVVVLNENGEVMAQYDPHGVDIMLGDQSPFAPGSAFKPLVTYALIKVGAINNPTDLTNDIGQSSDENRVALYDRIMEIKNATDTDHGVINFLEALSKSRNYPLQNRLFWWLLQGAVDSEGNFIYEEGGTTIKNIDGVIERWGRFQEELRNLGVHIVYVKPVQEEGSDEVNFVLAPIENPLSPDSPSNTPTFGTGVGSEITSSGVGANDDPTLVNFARAHLLFSGQLSLEQVHRFFPNIDQEDIDLISEIGQAIRGSGYDQKASNFWTQRDLNMFNFQHQNYEEIDFVVSKTSTVVDVDPSGREYISRVMAFYTIVFKDGRVRTVGVNLASYDRDGNPLPIDSTNPNSTQNALPLALSIALNSSDWTEAGATAFAQPAVLAETPPVGQESNGNTFVRVEPGGEVVYSQPNIERAWNNVNELNGLIQQIDSWSEAVNLIENYAKAGGQVLPSLEIMRTNLLALRGHLSDRITAIQYPASRQGQAYTQKPQRPWERGNHRNRWD